MDLAFNDPNLWLSLLTLTILEIVLGIDNLIFLSIVTDKLPENQRDKARKIGLAGALLMRIGLLASIVWIVGLTKPLMTIMDFELSWRDLILLGGGLFLLAKGTIEIHHEVEGEEEGPAGAASTTFVAAITQIMILDLVFSLDTVITAIGLTDRLPVMVTAVVIAMIVMIVAARPVGEFIRRHPTTKMLALSFLLLIGVALIADGLHFHIPREYIYIAIGFSILVEALNLARARRRRKLREAEQG